MRALIQRVTKASLSVNDTLIDQIGAGLVIYLGVESDDLEEDIGYLIKKCSQLRIFNDADNKMNASIMEVHGDFMVISQFTLHAKTKKGNRPSFIRAANPHYAFEMYENFKNALKQYCGLKVASGVFGAHMHIEQWNDGPVSIWLDSKNRE